MMKYGYSSTDVVQINGYEWRKTNRHQETGISWSWKHCGGRTKRQLTEDVGRLTKIRKFRQGHDSQILISIKGLIFKLEGGRGSTAVFDLKKNKKSHQML